MGLTRYSVRDEIKDTTEEFYRAVSNKSLKGIDAVWGHEPYATVAGRSGQINLGWTQVRGYWERRFQQLGDTKVSARLRNSISHAVGDVAWLSGTEIRTVKHGDQTHQEELRMTAVMERKGTGWQLVSYHASEPAAAASASVPVPLSVS
jgi:ketosteroid isomerase-like protein